MAPIMMMLVIIEFIRMMSGMLNANRITKGKVLSPLACITKLKHQKFILGVMLLGAVLSIN
ncbi:hypothetical protein C7E07_07245 [Klebsiella pneumoniae]|nr:hypothetical protein C7E07_07245 [Klebsiella pneumoniae]